MDDPDLESPTETQDTGPQPAASHRLSIVSYSHANGPLQLPRSPFASQAQMTFAVRYVPNPPAKLRRTHTGLSARLRKEIFGYPAARQRLDEIVEAVVAKMDELQETGGVSGHPLVPGKEDLVSEPPRSVPIVGICCEEGKHRSVSFAVELARGVRVAGWEVDIVRRDMQCSVEAGAVEREGENARVGLVAMGKAGKKERLKERSQGKGTEIVEGAGEGGDESGM